MNNKKISTRIVIAVIMIIAITAGIFIWKYEDKVKLEIQNIEQNQLKKQEDAAQQNKNILSKDKVDEIIFCGKTYKSDQLLINDTDVIKVIAKIAEKEDWICKNLELGKFQESGIGIASKKETNNSYLIVLFHKDNKNEEENPFNQSPFVFSFNFQNNNVFHQNQLDGSFKLLGDIK